MILPCDTTGYHVSSQTWPVKNIGMHRKMSVVQGCTLGEAKYHLKTKYRVSEEFIQHCKAYPLFGTGQGSGNSPTYWLFINSTLFDMYNSLAHGSQYQSQDRTTDISIKAIGFMDDVQTSINAFENNHISLEQLVAMAKQDSHVWHDILSTCNQELELPECGYHAIIFGFKP